MLCIHHLLICPERRSGSDAEATNCAVGDLHSPRTFLTEQIRALRPAWIRWPDHLVESEDVDYKIPDSAVQRTVSVRDHSCFGLFELPVCLCCNVTVVTLRTVTLPALHLCCHITFLTVANIFFIGHFVSRNTHLQGSRSLFGLVEHTSWPPTEQQITKSLLWQHHLSQCGSSLNHQKAILAILPFSADVVVAMLLLVAVSVAVSMAVSADCWCCLVLANMALQCAACSPLDGRTSRTDKRRA